MTVFAAATLTDALGEIATAYERISGQAVRLSFSAGPYLTRLTDKTPIPLIPMAHDPGDIAALAQDRAWLHEGRGATVPQPKHAVEIAMRVARRPAFRASAHPALIPGHRSP